MLLRCIPGQLIAAVQLCHVIGEAPQGGQILIDANCYADISNSLAAIASKVAPKPDLETLSSLQMWVLSTNNLETCPSPVGTPHLAGDAI